ncbi:MAG: hypothetical protein HY898_01345 [Deltaproteobacteria bacterium]|nr:hypothetical protein [Deltaproteobacteria bacterium]
MISVGRSWLRDSARAVLVLVVDHDQSSRRWLEETIAGQGHLVECAWDEVTALNVLRLTPGLDRAIVFNAALDGGGGQATLRAIRDFDPKARIIAFAAHYGIDFRIPLAVLPLPLDARSLELALHLVVNMGIKQPAADARRTGATARPMAA